MTPELRDRTATAEAERQYATAYDRHCDKAQTYRLEGKPLHERVANQAALICLRAYRSELRDARHPEG